MLRRLQFWKSGASAKKAGLYLGVDSLTAYLAPGTDTPAVVEQFKVLEDDFDGAMKAAAEATGAVHAALVLAPPHYQIVTLDRPKVANDELAPALLWAIKDLVTLSVDDIHYDYFSAPVVSSNKVNVVIVSKSWLSKVLQSAADHQINISHVVIEELALTHLFSGEESARMLLSQLPEQEMLLTVVKDGELYLQRRLRGFNQLANAQSSELEQDVADRLSLEVRRSMDFFESQLRQPPVSSINLLLSHQGDALQPLLNQNFNQAVEQVPAESVAPIMARMALMELEQEVAS
ncbi:MSHA biogenesis protein MshI [Paraferrimonas sedimenticola]|uniref:MSHA biogenesis protein MshI n=1 Tax=Paraferrimonas sedimenticola TaxID=375674 RepID=UPI0014729B10|nr:MSHA biogenesis protein MshI [Paraferrimonas sedimenticola]